MALFRPTTFIRYYVRQRYRQSFSAPPGPISGSGSPTADTATSTGAGVNTNNAIGSPTAETATSVGAAVGANKVSGSPTAETATSTGAGLNANSAIGSPVAETATSTGAGVHTNTAIGSPTAETATSTGAGTTGGGVPLSGIPAGFFSIPNCIKDIDLRDLARIEAEGAGVWAFWVAGVDLPDKVPKGSANLKLNIALIQNEAEGNATWARWAPGTQPENTGNLQLDMVTALGVDFVLS